MTKSFILAALALTSACAFGAEWDGSILPPANPPDFVKARWEIIAKQTWLPFDKWTWKKVGLPAGLEEQVWKAWSDGKEGSAWKNISPGFANVTYDAKVDAGVVTLILDGAGLVQSKDEGKTWKPLSHHLTHPCYGFFSFDISPADPKIIVVGGGYLDRSLDGGRSWSFIYDKALPEYGYEIKTSFGQVRFNADGSRLFTAPGAFGHGFEPRADIETLMEKNIGKKLIYVGDAKAANFKKIELGDFAAIRRIVPHPTNPSVVYASFSDGSIYKSSDASKPQPSFKKLELPKEYSGRQCIDLDIAPGSENDLLLVLFAKKGDSKLVHAKLEGGKLVCEELSLNGKASWQTIVSAKWNPRDGKEAVVGVNGANAIYVSNDSLKSFRALPFPEKLKHGESGFYSDPHSFAFDRKSPLAITWSCIGAWSSRDCFANLDDLLMTYDDSKKLYGNKGVGFAECGVSICQRKNHTYLATNDHGAFRSDGKDLSKWFKISRNPGMPQGLDGKPFAGLSFPLGVSEDEKYLYLFARMGYLHPNEKPKNGKPGPYSDDFLKLMLSTDKGDTWQDVTERLGNGETLRLAQQPMKIIFDPTDSNNQWILLREALFRSVDGGKSFQEGKLVDGEKFQLMLYIAYDAKHKILYANGGGKHVKLYRSLDLGLTWKEHPIKIDPPRITAVGVLENGDLVLGAEGRLVVMPYEKIEKGVVEESMVKMTIGDKLGAFVADQRDFHPVYCDGMDILTFANNSFRASNCCRQLGPLLSTDGGKSFKWINFDLPCQEGGSADLKDGSIIIGNRGIYNWSFR